MEFQGFCSPCEIRAWYAAIGELVPFIANLSERTGTKLIQNPKIPSAVSEALAARIFAIRAATPAHAIFTSGGTADVVMTVGDQITKIEVKGSGASEFATIGPQDLSCDALMWLRFGAIAQLSLESSLHWTIFHRPKECFSRPPGQRMTYGALRALASGDVEEGSTTAEELIGLYVPEGGNRVL